MTEYNKSLSCLFLGECYKKDYEYYFVLNNENIKADYCNTSLFGNTYCRIDNHYYTDVSYNYKFVGELPYKSNVYIFHPYFLLFIIPILMWCVLIYFFSGQKI